MPIAERVSELQQEVLTDNQSLAQCVEYVLGSNDWLLELQQQSTSQVSDDYALDEIPFNDHNEWLNFSNGRT